MNIIRRIRTYWFKRRSPLDIRSGWQGLSFLRNTLGREGADPEGQARQCRAQAFPLDMGSIAQNRSPADSSSGAPLASSLGMGSIEWNRGAVGIGALAYDRAMPPPSRFASHLPRADARRRLGEPVTAMLYIRSTKGASPPPRSGGGQGGGRRGNLRYSSPRTQVSSISSLGMGSIAWIRPFRWTTARWTWDRRRPRPRLAPTASGTYVPPAPRKSAIPKQRPPAGRPGRGRLTDAA